MKELLKHELLIKLIIEHAYVPHHSTAAFKEIEAAVNPGHKCRMGCSGYITDIARQAQVKINEWKAANITTFPEHKRKA